MSMQAKIYKHSHLSEEDTSCVDKMTSLVIIPNILECIQTVHLVITVDNAKARSICKCSSELLLCPDPTTTQLNWLCSASAQPVLRVHWLQLNVHHVIPSCPLLMYLGFKILQLIKLIQPLKVGLVAVVYKQLLPPRYSKLAVGTSPGSVPHTLLSGSLSVTVGFV